MSYLANKCMLLFFEQACYQYNPEWIRVK